MKKRMNTPIGSLPRRDVSARVCCVLASTAVIFALLCGSAAGQGVMKTAPAPNRNITLAGPQKQGAPSGPALPGTIEGFVYWDTGAVTHNPAGACDGFSVSVISGGHVLAVVSGQFGAKYIGQVKSYLVGGKIVAYDVCTYAYGNVAENVPLRVELNITQPTSFSTAVEPATPIVGPVTIINAQCNMLPNIATATLADLTAHWGSCQNMGFDVNFQLVPAGAAARLATLPPRTGSLLGTAPGTSGGEATSNSGGSLLSSGAETTMLSRTQQPAAGIANPLTNKDVIEKLRGRASEQEILTMIRTRASTFDVSDQARARFDEECYAIRPPNVSTGAWAREITDVWNTMENVVICQETNGRGGEGACDSVPAQSPPKGTGTGPAAVPSKAPPRNQYDAVTLDRGVTRDPGFANWANEKGSPSTTGAKPAVNAGDMSGASTGTNTGAKTADDLNPQPYPPKGTSTANNGTTSGSASAQSREAEKQLRAQLAKAPVPAKVIRIAAKTGAASAHATMLAVLEKQRQVANIESAQMKLGIRPQTQSVVLSQQSQLMSATGGGSAGGMAPQASVSQSASPVQGSSNSGSGNGGTGASTGKISSSMASLSYARTLIIECANDPTMRIVSVSGSSYPATFTPIDQYNLYTIRGCSFGEQAPTSDQSPTDWVHVYGGTGSFYGKFAIRFWSDNEIDVSLDESISGFPDLDNLNLVVKRADGKQTQKGGFKFYAARQTVLLQTIPQSWAKLYHFPDTWSSNYSSPPASGFLYPKPAISAPGPSAGSAYVSRSADGQRFDITLPIYDYYDFSHLAPGWTTDSFEIDPYEASCPADSGWTVTYKQSFGTWTGDWDGNNVRVGLSDTSCSGFWAPCVAAPWTCQNYQNWSGSYYALKMWVTGPRGTDPLTDNPTN